MSTPAQTAEFQQKQPARWNFITLVAFRFCFVYFGLFCLVTQIFSSMFPIPKVDVPDLGTLWPIRQITFWTATHVFSIARPLVYKGSGSGDKIFDWLLAFCLLTFSALATGVWSIIQRKHDSHAALFKWFFLFLRFALASQMFVYGMTKAIPVQMPFPYLTSLLEPSGNMSPMGVLWFSIGASPAYEIFAGCAEMLGGLFLIVPRTTTFGALVCLADMVQVFALNMTYDVPVKLFSFHLILMALFLLAPEFWRLANFFFLNRTVGPSGRLPLFSSTRANRAGLIVQLIFGLWLVAMNTYSDWNGWYLYGSGQPKSALYGIWDVDQLSIDGQLRSPLLTDYDRWHRIIFEFPTSMSFQRMDDSFAFYGASINVHDKTITLSKREDKEWKASFAYQTPTPDQLTLDGDMDSHKIHMQLQLFDRNKFLLVNRGFHWIQDYPYHR